MHGRQLSVKIDILLPQKFSNSLEILSKASSLSQPQNIETGRGSSQAFKDPTITIKSLKLIWERNGGGGCSLGKKQGLWRKPCVGKAKG